MITSDEEDSKPYIELCRRPLGVFMPPRNEDNKANIVLFGNGANTENNVRDIAPNVYRSALQSQLLAFSRKRQGRKLPTSIHHI